MTVSNALALRFFEGTYGSGDPASLIFKFFTTMPNLRTGVGAVVLSLGGYSNATVANNGTNFPSPTLAGGSEGYIQTVAAVVDFGAPTVPWSGIVGYGIYAGSDLWHAKQFDAPLSFVADPTRPVRFEASTIQIYLDPPA